MCVNVSLPLLVTVSGLLLVGCNRQSDSFAPQIVITSPASDTVTPRSNLVIKGYAWDDQGVMKLVLNGSTDLLAKGALSAQRGRKIVRFEIPADSLSGGKVSYELRAVDSGKRSATREIKVTVDSVLPKLTIDSVDSQADSIAVSGTATDNQKVSRIAVNGEPLNVSPASKIQFYTVIPRSRRGTITFIVKDGVGNALTKAIPVPAAPVIVPIAPPEGTLPRRRRRSGTTPPLPPTVAPIVAPESTPLMVGRPPR